MLSIKGLSVSRGQGSDAYGVSLPALYLERGSTMAVTGLSGTGKSTLLEMIGLVLMPDSVDSFQLVPGDDKEPLDIADLLRLSNQQALATIRSRYIGFVLQNGALLPFLTVAENLFLPRQLNGLPTKSPLVESLVETLGIGDLLKRKPRDLSVGQRQRVAFVRALAHEPALLLADEPTAALDPIHGEKLFQTILDVVEHYQVSALVVTHNLALIEQFELPAINGVSDSTQHSLGSVFR
ncbi:MAG: ABC transporter ATP-binding protein [Pseudomonadales bacterium]|nr:ABC transporter ATP-binding protein [Pseudomonadales bacterium]